MKIWETLVWVWAQVKAYGRRKWGAAPQEAIAIKGQGKISTKPLKVPARRARQSHT